MGTFNIVEYKQSVLESTNIDDCPKVPLPELNRNENYIFISYSHKDYKEVYSDLADLYVSGIPFWYDKGIAHGHKWDDVVKAVLLDPRCHGVIFYMSENLFASDAVLKEIRLTLGKDPGSLADVHNSIAYFSVNLTDLIPSKILLNSFTSRPFPKSDDGMQDIADWINTLNEAFSDKRNFLKHSPNPSHKDRLIEAIALCFNIYPNYNQYDLKHAISISGFTVIEFENGSRYEGEIKNGLFDGSGVLSSSLSPDLNAITVYEGEWREGKKNGKGVMTHPDGSSYNGEWQSDKRHGTGTMTYYDKSVYVGDWQNDKRHGKGSMTYPDSSKYNGEWTNGKRNGYGTYTFPDGSYYKGTWQNGVMHGKGIMVMSDGSVLEGEWNNGKRVISPDSIGAESTAFPAEIRIEVPTRKKTADVFNEKENIYSNDKGKAPLQKNCKRNIEVFDYNTVWQDSYDSPDGNAGNKFGNYAEPDDTQLVHDGHLDIFTVEKGELNESVTRPAAPSNNELFVPETNNDVRHSDSILTYPDGSRYIGELQKGKRHGYGTMIFPDDSEYTGNWSEDLMHGKGVFTYPDGTKCYVEMCNGKRHGSGKIIKPDGTVIDCRFENDELTEE